MAKTIRNMRATGITRKEIPVSPQVRVTLRGIPVQKGTAPKPPPKPARKGSIIFGTPTRYSGTDLPEETVIIPSPNG